MKKISREEFLKSSSLALAAAFTPKTLFSKNNGNSENIDQTFMKRLIEGNDEFVKVYLERFFEARERKIQYYRNLSGPFANLTAAYCHPKSKYHKSKDVLVVLQKIIDKLNKLQYPNGTLDSGGNRQSPPDTGFYLEGLCPAAKIIRDYSLPELKNVQADLEKFLLNAGEGIRTGGIHTPNHRWEVSSVLSKLYVLFKDQRYVDRIDEWLAEGIYQNSDGNYPERSRNYAIVENDAFISLAENLNRPELFEYVKTNLVTTFYYLEKDGELVSLDSRRQDQYRPISILKAYLSYRFMANHEKDTFLATITNFIENLNGFENAIVSRVLPYFMENPILSEKLPAIGKLPENYNKYLAESDLVRIKRNAVTASIYGGNDRPIIISSGRSCIPTFFTFRRNSAILKYMRLSSNFFNMGYIRGDGLKKEGNKYILHEVKEAYYFHPLPQSKINKDGDYKLTESTDRRFWSKLDFPDRPKTTLKLDSKIIVEELSEGFKIDFDISGADNVEITLELCFDKNGVLEGVNDAFEENEYFLEKGYAKYKSGDDVIEVGPGNFDHQNVSRIDGEMYSTHFGSVKGEGKHLYITGLVPFKHSITIK